MEFHPHQFVFCERPIAKLVAGGHSLQCQTAARMENGRSFLFLAASVLHVSKHSTVFLAPLSPTLPARTTSREERRRAKYEQKVDKETVPASEIILYALCVYMNVLSRQRSIHVERGDYSGGERSQYATPLSSFVIKLWNKEKK